MASVNPYSLLTQPLQSTLQSPLQSGIKRSNDRDASPLVVSDSSSTSARIAEASPPRVDLRARVESLIDSEVSNGSLTRDQSAQLKAAFDDAFGDSDAATSSLRGTPTAADRSPASRVESDSTSDLGIDTNREGSAEAMRQFLKSLQDTVDAQALPSYGPQVPTSRPPSQGAVPLLVNFRV